MTAAALRRLTLTNFRSYHAASLDVGGEPRRADRAERRRQDQPDRGDLLPDAGPRACAAPRFEEVAFSEGDGSWAVSAEVEGMLGLATLGTGIEPPVGGSRHAHAPLPDRPRAGRLRGRLRRSSARDLARRRRWTSCSWGRRRSAGAFSIAWCWRSTPSTEPRQRAGARAALAQPAAGGSAPRSALARRHRARDRGARGRGGGAARRDRAPSAGALAARKDDAFPSAEIALDGWMERLLPDHPAVEIEERYRGILQGQPRPRRRRRPHARRPASHRSRRRLFAEEHPRRRRFDRRAEGAADRPRARACGSRSPR